MPAIPLARLKKQVAELADLFHDPVAFRSALSKILDEYADRIRRHGQAGEPPPLTTAYNVPAPVLRQILIELSSYPATYPESGLTLCDYLWKQSYLEEKLLAAFFLGYVKLAHPQPVLERAMDWLASKPEEKLVNAILDHSLVTLRQYTPEIITKLIEEWIVDSNPYYKSLGLKALLPLIDQQSFDDLSIVFGWINPLIRASPSEVKSDVISVLRVLARRAPNETAYTLRRIMESSEDNHAAWYIRQSLQFFPGPMQAKLRQALQEDRHRTR